MEYTILNTTIKEIHNIEVKFDFMELPIIISVFDPRNEDEKTQAIQNRYTSEFNALNPE